MASYYQLPAVDLTPTESFTLVVPGQGMGEAERMAAVAYLTSSIRGGKSTLKTYVETVSTLMVMAFPGLGPALASMVSVNVTVYSVTGTQTSDFIGNTGGGVGGWSNLKTPTPPMGEAVAVDSVLGVYAGVASILMSVGRQSNPGPEAASVKSRPAALIGRFQIPEDQQDVLPGRSCGPDQTGLERMYASFSTYSEPRACLIKYFLSVGISQSHLPLPFEIVMTNFRLMRGAGMTHVEAINKLMNMHPWTVRVPALAPYYAKYASELIEFSKIPRDMRFYHRLLVPQSEFMFLTPEYKPLIAVAGSFVKDVESTFKGYVYGEKEFESLITDVRSYAPGTATYVGGGDLARQLGIQDMELPMLHVTKAVKPTPMV